jgi:hypothetical protein
MDPLYQLSSTLSVVSGKGIAMKRHMVGITLMLVGLLATASCGFGVSPLSKQQLQEFIQQQNIQSVAVEENVGGDVTVILYKDAKEMGCYVAFDGNGIRHVQSYNNFTNLAGTEIEPVSFTLESLFIKYDIVCLTINDKEIRDKAYTIKVIFSSGGELNVPVTNNGDMIIYREAEVDSAEVTIIIYDANQHELIRSPFW